MTDTIGANELILLCGPLKEFQGKADENIGIRIVSNGKINTLKMSANIKKTAISVPNQSQISIWNLSEETRSALVRSEARIELYAGQEGQEKELIFTGGLLQGVIERQGNDIITRLIALDGQSSIIRASIADMYEANTPIRDIIIRIAKNLPGVEVRENEISVKDKTTGQEMVAGYKGISLIGSAKNCLDKLGRQFGFSWSIQNGIFTVIKDGNFVKSGVVLGADTRLIKVSPLLSGPAQQQIGTTIESIYTPGVMPGHSVRVESKINPALNGEYSVHTVSYDLCPKTSQWNIGIESFITTFGEQKV